MRIEKRGATEEAGEVELRRCMACRTLMATVLVFRLPGRSSSSDLSVFTDNTQA